MGSEVEAKCKKCNRTAKASEFVLDPVYKIMVCQSCSKERLLAERSAKKPSFSTYNPSGSGTQTQMQKPVGGGFDARHTNNLGVQPKSTTVSEPPKKPLGWDDDDDYLEFKAKEKQENQRSGSSVVEKIDGDRATLHCPKCDFKFIYNISSRTPSSCPYCGVKLNINVK